MKLTPDGAQHFPAAFSSDQIEALTQQLSTLPQHVPGIRLKDGTGLASHIQPATDLAKMLLGDAACPVRATLFDKTPNRNWALGWHQDRTIAVRSKILTQGFNDWTVKHGLHYVVPPFYFIERMLTFRIHLDRTASDNAPLLVAPSSHLVGRLTEQAIAPTVERLGTKACIANEGDIWVYSTPILHASEAATTPVRRRVLQILYSADDLPGALEWLGI